MDLSPGALVSVPLPSGRFAAVWITEVLASLERRGKPQIGFFVLAVTWSARPAAAELRAAKIARATSPRLPGVADVWKGCFWGAIPADFDAPATKTLSAKQRALAEEASGTMVFQSAEHVRAELHRNWRLEHDRDALFAEYDRAAAAREERAEARRAKTTLPRMARERPFAHWASRCSARVLREVRRIFREATLELVEHEGATKRKREAIVRRIVTELNALYDHEGFIETPEREELVARIEELAGLAKISNDDERLTGHRDW